MTAPYPIGRFGPPRAAPTLSTVRLTLDAMTGDDWPDYWTLMSSDRARFMGGPLDVPEAWGWFCSDVAGWALRGSGSLAIRCEGVTVGQISLNDLPFFPEPELGWFLHAGHEGRGYATEAAAAVLEWLRVEHRPPSLVSYASPDNAPSVAVANRLGAVRDENALVPEEGDLCLRYWGLA